MTKFIFRLQPLVKIREADRDRRRQELADAYRAEQLLSDRQAQLLQEMKATQSFTRRQSQPGRIEVDQLLQSHRYELLLTAQLQQLAVQRQKVEAEIEIRRRALVDADREVRILEKLRERQADEYRRREARLETRQLDEIALRGRHGSGDNLR